MDFFHLRDKWSKNIILCQYNQNCYIYYHKVITFLYQVIKFELKETSYKNIYHVRYLHTNLISTIIY